MSNNTQPTFRQRGNWITLPEAVLAKHGIIIGGSGSGKTETLLRIAYAAASYGYRIFFLDGKGDRDLAARFLASLWGAGKKRINMFPTQSYFGWSGDQIALLNRLLSIADYTEPYYLGIAQRLLSLALGAPGGLPHSSTTLLERLNRSKLKELYSTENNEKAIADIDALEKRDAFGVYNRYKAFFDLVGDGLDGDLGRDGFSFDDGDGGYILLDGLALRAQAASLGRYIVEDFAHYVSKRKHPSQKTLLIIDEFSALKMTEDAANLFERIRSYNGAILVSSQSYAGLGESADRLLGAANLLLLHQSNDPEWLSRRAGSAQQVAAGWSVDEQLATGRGTMRLEEMPRIHPDRIRRLPPGELYLVNGAQSYRMRVARVAASEEGLQQAQDYIESGPDVEIKPDASTDPAASTVPPDTPSFDPYKEKE